MPTWFPRTLADAVQFVPLRVAFLIVLALVARAVVNGLIDRAVRRSTGDRKRLRIKALQVLRDSESDVGDGRRDSRIRALGSLARSAVSVVITLVALLMIFSELGFNITSIIAGTSIITVTIAFGLQNVVKDLVSGVFLLVEDQFGVGDYVDMKEASGTVEAIGLRTTTLRDDSGNTWYVRNGELVRVGNYSQGGTGRPPTTDTVQTVRLVEGSAST
ncbi:mechanosensitive ion channel family protein [Microlunatus antarcticus]|uniref:Small conductance mechanosensitive channel n=1 Tax=Microlunatus antarcticus TaxID=53388 RepID=A0A7W5P5X7_9ACTN|nr:mechanosensitive ion channel domain-containing protein [Microlunatus antarcticus]MBB3325924.1 small conductance mechanosensitive channel [Microlunatus antarcticus]